MSPFPKLKINLKLTINSIPLSSDYIWNSNVLSTSLVSVLFIVSFKITFHLYPLHYGALIFIFVQYIFSPNLGRNPVYYYFLKAWHTIVFEQLLLSILIQNYVFLKNPQFLTEKWGKINGFFNFCCVTFWIFEHFLYSIILYPLHYGALIFIFD